MIVFHGIPGEEAQEIVNFCFRKVLTQDEKEALEKVTITHQRQKDLARFAKKMSYAEFCPHCRKNGSQNSRAFSAIEKLVELVFALYMPRISLKEAFMQIFPKAVEFAFRHLDKEPPDSIESICLKTSSNYRCFDDPGGFPGMPKFFIENTLIKRLGLMLAALLVDKGDDDLELATAIIEGFGDSFHKTYCTTHRKLEQFLTGDPSSMMGLVQNLVPDIPDESQIH